MFRLLKVLSDQNIFSVPIQSQDHTSPSAGSIICQQVKLPDHLSNRRRKEKKIGENEESDAMCGNSIVGMR